MHQLLRFKNGFCYGQHVLARIRCCHNIATELLPVPKNIDFAETTRFSPRRNREISATALLTHKQSDMSLSNHCIEKYNSGTVAEQDLHIQSYDCFGSIRLNSAMQSNVPTPFRGMDSHLNMPHGQLAQESKFMSYNLQNSHYTTLRRNARAGWSTYDKDATIQNKDPSNTINDQSKRKYCTKIDEKQQVPTKKEQLKKAFKDYGSTIVVFHITISLMSLGGFYLLISSGVNVIDMLDKLGYAPTALKNNAAIGASNFVIAYAIHKIFAPVRMSITLGATPFIVRYLRSKGLLKTKVKSKVQQN